MAWVRPRHPPPKTPLFTQKETLIPLLGYLSCQRPPHRAPSAPNQPHTFRPPLSNTKNTENKIREKRQGRQIIELEDEDGEEVEVAEIAEQSGECGYDCTDRERELHRERMNRRLQAAGRYHVQEIISPPPPPPPAQPIRPREKPAARVAKASVAKPEAGLRPWQQRRYDPGDFASRSTPRWAEQPERRWVGVAEERWANATTPLRM